MTVGEKVNSNKNTAIIVGVLFIVATITYASGSAMIEPLLGNSGGIATPLVIGSLLEFIDVIAVIIIGVLLFPILKNYSILIAWTYLGTRILEAAFLSVSIASIFLTTALWYERAFQIAFLVLGLGSLPFVYLLYKSKLIPRFYFCSRFHWIYRVISMECFRGFRLYYRNVSIHPRRLI